MATSGSNYCPEALRNRRVDLAIGLTCTLQHLAHAIAAAEMADLGLAISNLEDAISAVSKMRSDLEDLALEAERKMDAGL